VHATTMTSVTTTGAAGQRERAGLREEPGLVRSISSATRRLDGPRLHMGLMDEAHEHISSAVTGKIRQGARRRHQPMFVEMKRRVRSHVSVLGPSRVLAAIL
jgi:hypothetical protein